MISKGVLHGLDLFSGIGGLTKALDGYVRPVAYCEIEPYARGVLLSRMHSGDLPLAPIWDDILTLHGTMLPQVNVIYGGFPCQDISTAGYGKGLGGKRSGLFFEIVRLAEEIKPEFIFLENVANIRSKGLDRVLIEVARLGYDCRYGILSASDVGAPHRRDRWWLLAHRNVCSRSTEFRKQQEEWPEIADSSGTGDVANADGTRLERDKFSELQFAECNRNTTSEWWATEPNVGRVAYGIPKRMDRLRALGNAVVPQCAREAFERLIGLKCAE
jgi:DNA (cytosine-5)-methyltransferase 1